MAKIIIFSALLACAAAVPGYLVSHETPVIHSIPLTAKSTITKNTLNVNHGGHAIVHTPVVPLHTVHAVHSVPLMAKSTITKSSLNVNHGGHAVLHTPVLHEVHAPLVHSVPLSAKSTITRSSLNVNHGGHALFHTPAVHAVHAPLVTLKSGDSAVSHSSQSVQETVPYYAVHH